MEMNKVAFLSPSIHGSSNGSLNSGKQATGLPFLMIVSKTFDSTGNTQSEKPEESSPHSRIGKKRAADPGTEKWKTLSNKLKRTLEDTNGEQGSGSVHANLSSVLAEGALAVENRVGLSTPQTSGSSIKPAHGSATGLSAVKANSGKANSDNAAWNTTNGLTVLQGHAASIGSKTGADSRPSVLRGGHMNAVPSKETGAGTRAVPAGTASAVQTQSGAPHQLSSDLKAQAAAQNPHLAEQKPNPELFRTAGTESVKKSEILSGRPGDGMAPTKENGMPALQSAIASAVRTRSGVPSQPMPNRGADPAIRTPLSAEQKPNPQQLRAAGTESLKKSGLLPARGDGHVPVKVAVHGKQGLPSSPFWGRAMNKVELLVAYQNNTESADHGLPVHQQVSDKVSEWLTKSSFRFENNGEQKLTMTLNPEQLGRVTITLTKDGGGISAQLTAETKTARDLLQSGIAQLRQDIAGRGLSVNQIDISKNWQAAGSDPSQQMSQNQQFQDHGGQSRGREEEQEHRQPQMSVEKKDNDHSFLEWMTGGIMTR